MQDNGHDQQWLKKTTQRTVAYLDALPTEVRPTWYYPSTSADRVSDRLLDCPSFSERLDELICVLRRTARNETVREIKTYLNDVVHAVEAAEDMWEAKTRAGEWLSYRTQEEYFEVFAKALASRAHAFEDGEQEGYALVLRLLPVMSVWHD